MAQRSGLVLKRTVDDFTGFQFWGSEHYQRDISLQRNALSEPLFSKRELAEYERRAAELNARARGDQAAFVLQKER